MQCRVGFLETFLEIDLRRRQGRVSRGAPYTFIPTHARETNEHRSFGGTVQGGVYGRGVGLLVASGDPSEGVVQMHREGECAPLPWLGTAHHFMLHPA